MKILDKLIVKTFELNNCSEYYGMVISRNNNRFLMGIERSLSQKRTIKKWENIPIQLQLVHNILSLKYSFRTE